MRTWFESLAPRERVMVTVCGIVVAIAVLWFLLWTPLDNRHEKLRADVGSWENGLAALQRVAELQGTAQQRTGGSPTTRSRTPVVIVDTTLRARGLSGALRGSQPTTSTGIRLEFENVAFDALVLWLGDLSNQHGMDVQAGTLQVAQREEPGRINATLTLERQP
ncbi:MAG: type II secretion system protein M [Pseudomonadota bacterium]